MLLEVLAFWVFFIDIIITLNTGFYRRGTIVYNKHLILKNYIFNQFTLDLISLGPFFVQNLLKSNGRILQLLFLLRIMKVKKIMKKIKEHLLLPEQFLSGLELLKLLFLVVYLAHICGCAWHFVALVKKILNFFKI